MNKVEHGRNGRLAAGIAVTAAMLVPLAVFGAPALARSGASAGSEYKTPGQYQYRVEICHITGSKKHPAHTITVAASAVPAHLRHGDHLGPCTGTEKPRAKHSNQGNGQLVVDGVDQLEVLLGGGRRQDVERRLDRLAQDERPRLELDAPGLDLREVQDVVEQPQ